MKLLAALGVASAVICASACGGDDGDQPWSPPSSLQQPLANHLQIESEPALRLTPDRALLQRVGRLQPPDPGEESSTLYPDHYTLSDDKYCGHTRCPADETAPCEVHSAAVAEPMCACRVRGYMFVCH